MRGNESLRSSLRSLTAIELFLNIDYYAHHPCLMSELESSECIFRSEKAYLEAVVLINVLSFLMFTSVIEESVIEMKQF